MATYSVTINERTALGKGLVNFLSTLPEIKFGKVTDNKPSYNPEYVAMIKKSQKEAKEGKVRTLKTEGLWKL